MGDCVCNVEEPAEAFVVLTQSKHVLKAKCYWVCKFSCNSKPLFQLKIFIIQRKVDLVCSNNCVSKCYLVYLHIQTFIKRQELQYLQKTVQKFYNIDSYLAVL